MFAKSNNACLLLDNTVTISSPIELGNLDLNSAKLKSCVWEAVVWTDAVGAVKLPSL